MINKCQVVWNLTSKCNENCKYCFRKKCKDISLEKNKKIVDKITNLNIETLSLSGGEALLYDDIFKLVQYIKIKLPHTKLILNTNGKNINENILNEIVNNFDAITLPIDSTDCVFNSKIGRGFDHNSNVLNIIKYCNNKVGIKINTLITNENIGDIENIYNLLKDYNITRWKIFRFLPVRDAKRYANDFNISDEISKGIEDKIDSLNNNSNIEISYNREKSYKTKYFIYPDGTVENNKLELIGNLLTEYNLIDNFE